jgi:diacylglycerol kinase family enzyme
MKPPGLLVNVRAGRVRRDPGLVERLGRLVPQGYLEATHTPGEIEPALMRLQSRGVETLGIVGGDGTATWTLTALLRTWPSDQLPSLLLLAGGTVNTIPAAAGARGRPDRVLERLIESGRTPPSFARSVLQVRGDRREPRWGLIFGNGIVSRWLARYNARVRNGILGAVAEVSRAVGSAALGGSYARTLPAFSRSSPSRRRGVWGSSTGS